MARCPHLGLEEYRTSPFPFASASHRCYVSLPGVPVGQKEQEKYCLSDNHRSCPLFPFDPFEETPVAAAEPIAQSVGTDAPAEFREASEVSEAPGVSPLETAPPPTGPEAVVSVPPKEKVTPAAVEKIVPEQARVNEAAPVEPVVSQEESPEVPSETRTRPVSVRVRRLVPAAVGAFALLLVCAAAAVVVWFAGPAVSTVDFGALQPSSLGPALLLLVSGGSFAVATLLLVLFLLVGRLGSA